MPTPADHIPDDGTGLARRIAALESRLQRLEAARRVAQVGVSTGELAANGGTPVLYLVSPDIGLGPVSVQLRGASADGLAPAAALVVFPDGTTMTVSRSGASLESWAALSLSNGWSAAGSTWASPVVRRQADGTVHLSGEIAPGTLTAGTTITTLPVGYRPAADLTFRVPGGSSTTGADLYVKSGGTVTIQNVAGTPTRVGLAGVRFPL